MLQSCQVISLSFFVKRVKRGSARTFNAVAVQPNFVAIRSLTLYKLYKYCIGFRLNMRLNISEFWLHGLYVNPDNSFKESFVYDCFDLRFLLLILLNDGETLFLMRRDICSNLMIISRFFVICVESCFSTFVLNEIIISIADV